MTPATALDFDNLSEAERSAFRAEVRAYLLDNPEVIIEAVEQLESRQAQDQAAQDAALVSANAEDIFDDGYSWVGGNPDGDITLVEFMDYRCGYCRRAFPEVEELIASDGNIRLIVKEFPILGEDSMLSSRFAVAVKQMEGDDAYKSAHDALMTLKSEVTPTALERLADNLGMDANAILEHMDSPEVTEEIRQTRALAQRLQITGTPTFVMEDQLLRGYLPLDNMRALVAQKRQD
ncbi:DsbA family protein [Salinihabitans flavidus]|nr:DsbA family protein [Salinihabitans flavidus]